MNRGKERETGKEKEMGKDGWRETGEEWERCEEKE